MFIYLLMYVTQRTNIYNKHKHIRIGNVVLSVSNIQTIEKINLICIKLKR